MSRLLAAGLIVVGLTLILPTLVTAGTTKNRDDVRVTGTCTKSSSSKLKLSDEDGAIEVEFEVDQNRNGVPWKVTLRRNGAVVKRATAVTRGPSGSFSLRRVISRAAGANTIAATAKSPSGETCTARASL